MTNQQAIELVKIYNAFGNKKVLFFLDYTISDLDTALTIVLKLAEENLKSKLLNQK